MPTARSGKRGRTLRHGSARASPAAPDLEVRYGADATRRATATHRRARSTARLASASGTASGLVLRLRLQWQQPGEVLLQLRAVLACLAQQWTNLLVILPGSTAPGSLTGDGVGGVDRGVDGEARGRDRPTCVELARRRSEVLLGLAQVAADLRRADRPRSPFPRHFAGPGGRRSTARGRRCRRAGRRARAASDSEAGGRFRLR